MIILDTPQYSDEWFAARCGIPTTSRFDKIITPTGKPSTSATGYRRELLAEWLTGAKTEIKQNEWMLRGLELEPEARSWYEFHQTAQVSEVGLIFKDDRRLVSCSPDGLVGETGGLEIKCPASGTHVGYLLDNKIPTTYIPQVQGSMWVTGREWWDFVSYHPQIDPMIIRVERDDDWIKKFEPIIEKFIDRMLEERIKLIQQGAKNEN